jgi:hypothetical protein
VWQGKPTKKARRSKNWTLQRLQRFQHRRRFKFAIVVASLAKPLRKLGLKCARQKRSLAETHRDIREFRRFVGAMR